MTRIQRGSGDQRRYSISTLILPACSVFGSRVTKDAEIQKLRRGALKRRGSRIVAYPCIHEISSPFLTLRTSPRVFRPFFYDSTGSLTPFSVSCTVRVTAVVLGLIRITVVTCVTCKKYEGDGGGLLYLDTSIVSNMLPPTSISLHICDLILIITVSVYRCELQKTYKIAS